MESARRYTPGPQPGALIPIREPRTVTDHTATLWSLIEHALAGLKPATRKAYGEDLAAFAAWMGAPYPAWVRVNFRTFDNYPARTPGWATLAFHRAVRASVDLPNDLVRTGRGT